VRVDAAAGARVVRTPASDVHADPDEEWAPASSSLLDERLFSILDVARRTGLLLSYSIDAEFRTRRASLPSLVDQAEVILVADSFSRSTAPGAPGAYWLQPQGHQSILVDRRRARTDGGPTRLFVRVEETAPSMRQDRIRHPWPAIVFLRASPGGQELVLTDPEFGWLKASRAVLEKVNYRLRRNAPYPPSNGPRR
jgi:hypothetical protein